jgi:DNA-binding FadR family transcriptional regulator
MFTEPIKKNSLSDVVAEKLQKLIASGKFKIGDQLPSEPDLMEYFGVGLSTIREAIRILSYSGILKAPIAGVENCREGCYS